MNESPSADASTDRAIANPGIDPLEVVTDLDVAALQQRSGVIRGTSADGVLRANDRFLELTGMIAPAARGWDWLLSIHGDDRDRVRRALDAACVSGARSSFSIRARLADGELGELRVTVTGVSGSGGRNVFVAAFDVPTPVAVAATEPVPEFADPFEVLVNSLPVALAYVAPSGIIDYANEAWAVTTSVAEGTLLLEHIDVGARATELHDALETGASWVGPATHSGATVELTTVPIAPADGGGTLVMIAPIGVSGLRTSADEPAELSEPDSVEVVDDLEQLIAPIARLVDVAPDYAAILDPEGAFLYVNGPACRMMGIDDPAALIGTDAISMVEFGGGAETPPYEDLLRDGSLLLAGDMRLGSAEPVPVALMLYVISDEAGEHRATLAIARDRSDVHAARRQVAASEATMSAIVDPAPVAIFVVDDDGAVTVWNEACAELFGWTSDEVVGGLPPFLPEGFEDVAARMDARIRAGEVLRGPSQFRHRNGDPIYAELASAPVRDATGEVRSVVTVAVDRTRAERATRELEYRADVDQLVASIARSLVDATADTVADRVVQVLHGVAERCGADSAVLAGRGESAARYSWPADAMTHVDPADGGGAFCAATIDGEVFTAGWVLAGGAGALGTLALRWSFDPEIVLEDLDALEMITTALVAAVDRVDAERAVHASEQRFRALAEHSKDLVAVVSGEMELLYVSPSATKLVGLTISTTFDPGDGFVHPDDRLVLIERMTALVAAPTGTSTESFRSRFRVADGEYRTFELIATNLLEDPVVEGVVLNGRDVTARQAMEERLRDSERRFRGLVQNLAESVVILGPDGNVTYASPAGTRMLGFEAGHGDGMTALDFVLEPDRERVAEVVARAFTEPGVHGPVTLRIADSEGRIRTLEALGHNRLDDPDVEGVVVTARDITERVEAEDAARRSDARLGAIVENLSDVVTIVDEDGTIAYTSPTAERLFGFTDGDESFTDPVARVHPDDRDEMMAGLAEHLDGANQDPVRFRLRAGDGSWRVVEAIARDMTDDPDVAGLVVTTRDVSDRMRAESLVTDQAKVLTRIARGARLHETLTSICDVLERQVPGSAFGVLLIDATTGGVELGAGPRIPAELANAIEAAPIDPEDPRLRVADVVATAGPSVLGSDWRSSAVREVADRLGIATLWSTPITDSASMRVIGVICGCLESAQQVSTAERGVVEMFAQTAGIAVERQVSEDLLAYRANHDALTGLPNRVLFIEFLSHALSRAQRGGNGVAVLFLDLDRFKHINDGLGHDAGDVLLRQLAERLRVSMRPADVVARFGGDEFTVLCDGLAPDTAVEQVSEVARRLLEVIERPLTIEGEDRRLSASVGIAIATPDSTADGLLRDADAAMYEAKQHGKARWEIFDDAMRSTMNARLDLETRLERALERDEFRLFLQPIVDLASGRCVGGEALLRWQDPEIGIITPDHFIGLAEETGLIIPMGEWALAEACRTVARWEEVGLLAPDFTMAVNLSARQVAQADLVERVRSVIERSGPMASRICLEITESVLMEESSVEAIHALKALGVRLSIDDFGTGYSSLGYLKRFPVDSVKVDRSFVDGLGTDSEDSAIVTAVVSLGHALGLAVVAEGVETVVQLRELLNLGCDRAQGYWFSGPRSVTEFAGLLHAQPWLDDSRPWAS